MYFQYKNPEPDFVVESVDSIVFEKAVKEVIFKLLLLFDFFAFLQKRLNFRWYKTIVKYFLIKSINWNKPWEIFNKTSFLYPSFLMPRSHIFSHNKLVVLLRSFNQGIFLIDGKKLAFQIPHLVLHALFARPGMVVNLKSQ